MAMSVLLLTFVVFAQAEELDFERWNTPPELTPESVVKTPGDENLQTRLFPLVPVTATVGLNGGHNAHSVSLGASLDGISLSGSNSYARPAGNDGSTISGSQSATISAGLSGIATAGAEAHSNGENAKSESHSLGFGQASATSFGAVENGRAITGAASSVGASQSSAASGGNRGRSFTEAVGVRYQNRPAWNNAGPNYRRNDRPTLTISRPYDRTWPRLHVDVHETNRREPTPAVRIYKWYPDRGGLSRPGLTIEQQAHNAWNDRGRGSTGLQIGVGSSSYGFSGGDSASPVNRGPLTIAFSSSGRVHTSGSAPSHPQGWRSSEYPFGDFSADDRFEGTTINDYKGENSVAQVNARDSGNGRAHGIALSVGESFVRFPDENEPRRTIPLHHVRSNDSKRKRLDSDILFDLTQTVGELLDVV